MAHASVELDLGERAINQPLVRQSESCSVGALGVGVGTDVGTGPKPQAPGLSFWALRPLTPATPELGGGSFSSVEPGCAEDTVVFRHNELSSHGDCLTCRLQAQDSRTTIAGEGHCASCKREEKK